MDLLDVIFIAFGLAMDAFAISIAVSGTGRINDKRAVFRLSFHFGLFQFLMPVIGWFAGANIAPIIAAYDHWVAFILLQFIAVRMIILSRKDEEFNEAKDPSKGFSLIILSLATSIDALAVGFSLAMIRINIWYPSVIIGLITASLSLFGIAIGKYSNKKFGKISAVLGGIILSAIGFRILYSHL